jgi:hypothetical protein
VLTKEKWEITGSTDESTGRSQNISLIVPLFTFEGHSYVIMYLLCIKEYSVVVCYLSLLFCQHLKEKSLLPLIWK